MKKITLLAAAFAVSTFMNAQTEVLSHSTDNATVTSGGVACATDPDEVPGTGDEGNSDNTFFRSYTPSEFGYSGSFDVIGANFFLSFSDNSGTNPTHDYTVRFFISSDVFPAGELTEVASIPLQATAADDGMLIEATLDSPLTLPATTEIIIAVEIPAALPTPDNYDVRIGVNDLGEDGPSYLAAEGCGLESPDTFASIGFPDNNIILDLVTGTLSADSALASKTSFYPNPVNNVLNISVPSSIQIEGATMYDILGKGTQVEVSANNTINTSSLASGVYLLTVKTNEGNITKKVVKQ